MRYQQIITSNQQPAIQTMTIVQRPTRRLLLACALLPLLLNKSAAATCPVILETFSSKDCINTDTDAARQAIYFSENQVAQDGCQFIPVLDGLFQTFCNENDNSLTFQPCISSPFTTSQTFPLNTCQNGKDDRNDGSFIFTGITSCNDQTSCLATQSPTSSTSPTQSPTSKYTIAAFVEDLQSPPPRVPFADDLSSFLSVQEAHEMVHLAGTLIYKMNNSNAASLVPEGYKFHLYLDTGSTEVLILTTTTSSNRILVIFRGTDDTLDGDWLTNINVPKVQYGPPDAILDGKVTARNVFGFQEEFNIRVHRGFNSVFSNGLYESVSEVIGPLLLERHEQDGVGESSLVFGNEVYFGGHSLGGANAQVFGTYFAFFHPTINTHITTLGSPRQGNYAYKVLGESLMNLRVWRLVNCRDVVPRAPLFQYYHSGHLVWKRCDGPMNDKIGNAVVEAYYRDSGEIDLNYAHVPSSFVVRSNEETMISDHFGGSYIEWVQYALQTGRNWTSVFEPVINGTSTEQNLSGTRN